MRYIQQNQQEQQSDQLAVMACHLQDALAREELGEGDWQCLGRMDEQELSLLSLLGGDDLQAAVQRELERRRARARARGGLLSSAAARIRSLFARRRPQATAWLSLDAP